MTWIERREFPIYRSFNLSQLSIDYAWLNISNFASEQLWLYKLSSDCHECPYQLWEDLIPLLPGTSSEQIVSSKFPSKYRFRREKNSKYVLDKNDKSMFCEIDGELGEFGVFDLYASESGKCSFETQLEPVNIYLPLAVVAIFYAMLTILILLWGKYKDAVARKLKLNFLLKKSLGESIGKEETNETLQVPAKKRLKSLDTFRGFCIVIMMFVHDGRGEYAFFDHSTWDGLYVADLVFPWFLWIMGVCIPISIKSQLRKKLPKLQIFKGIVIRSLKLIALGLIVASRDGPVDIKDIRLPGVLQRFGICYFSVASIMLFSAGDEFVYDKTSGNKFFRFFRDILLIWKGWLIAIGILLIHTLLTFLLKIPGCPTGYTGPGGLHLYKDIDKYPDPSICIGGSAGYIDKQVLSIKHIYNWPTALFTYDAEAYDPEGILGTLTSIFQVWLGVQTGLTLQVFPKSRSRLVRWGVWAIITGGIGAALCEAKQTGGLIPLNKNLWSISFVLVTSCFALILLSFLYVIIDIKNWWSGTPFYEPGMNSILLYIAHLIGNDILPFHFNYQDKLSRTHFLKLVESLWGISCWILVSIYLCHIKYFWTL